MCCKRLAGNTGCKNDAENRHLSTIAQLCRAISLQLRHVSTIGKNLLSSNFSSRCPYSMVNFGPHHGWDWLAGLGHPIIFQRVSRLGSVTAWHSSSGRQPNFVALNRGRHLCSAGQPSRWALAHILVVLGLLSSVLAKRLAGMNVSEMTVLCWVGCNTLTQRLFREHRMLYAWQKPWAWSVSARPSPWRAATQRT